jgi:hypothetical protein
MKKIYLPKFILLFLFLNGITYISFAQTWPVLQAWIPAYNHAKQVQQNNEFVEASDDASDFYCNPLLLNGKMLDYNTFTLESKGTLSVVKGNPSDSKAEKIPFTIMVRREGKIITTIDVSAKELYEIDIAKVFTTAKSGDQLIVDPVNPKDSKAKRILKLLYWGC